MKLVHFEISINNLCIEKFHLIRINPSEFVYYNVHNRGTINSVKQDLASLHGSGGIICNDKYDNCERSVAENQWNKNIGNNIEKYVSLENKNCYVLLLNDQIIKDCDCQSLQNDLKIPVTIKTNENFLKAFYKTLKYSPLYCYYVINKVLKLKESSVSDNIILRVVNIIISSTSRVDGIDFRWNEKLQKLWWEKKELDGAMSWLSTLGGACSALGDSDEYFAGRAARISIQQFRLAVKLGDELTVSRCKLYYALSLIQKGYYKMAHRIINEQYSFATSFRIKDNRLISMCLGIHAKLQYEYNQTKRNKQIPNRGLME